MLTRIDLDTPAGENLIDITSKVQQVFTEGSIQEGIAVIFVPHSTAALTLNSGIDPNTTQDIIDDFRRLVPIRLDFHHIYDTPADAAGHVKSVLVGNSLTLIVSKGKLLLGSSQSILFFEFDGPRRRQVWVQTVADG